MQETDATRTVDQLKELVRKFCSEREWDQFHNAKELSIGICTEASELLQHFRFKSETDVEQMMTDSRTRSEIDSEIADVFFFLLRMSQRYDVDLSCILRTKLDANATRYPIEMARGSNKKYGES